MSDQSMWPALRGARVRHVIEVEFNHGLGADESDPVRRVLAYFDEDGVLLAWNDPSDFARRIDGGFLTSRFET